MLAKLYIENIAVIRQAEINFTLGLNVFTGETGAGKTILVNAINAVLGERTSKDIIRTGESKALVSALFVDIPRDIGLQIEALGFVVGEDGLLITREIEEEGKGNCRIGGKPVTAAVLREVASRLIAIHGQQDNQELLVSERHIHFVDSYGELGDILGAYQEAYRQVCSLRTELEHLTMDENMKAQRLDMLGFQIQELEAAQLQPGEDEVLAAQRKVIKNAERISEAVALAQGALSGDGDGGGILPLMSGLVQGLQAVTEFAPDFAVSAVRAQEMEYELEEMAGELRRYTDGFDFNPRQLDDIEERLDMLYRFKKKYGESVEEMLAYLDKAKEELEHLNDSDERIGQIQVALEIATAKAQALADELTEKRLAAAEGFIEKVEEELQFLDMPLVKLQLRHEKKPMGSGGQDGVEFLISTNAGEMPRPLAKIASGGEIARLMLSIKNVLADKDEIATLIFDEVDTGVSGRAANKIGQKLAQVAANRQVICVTHLAQVAAYGSHHLYIHKTVENDRTFTKVTPLDRYGRVKELARIVSGDNVTALALRNAEEMLRLCGN